MREEKQPLPVDENCIAAFDAWLSPAVYAVLKRDGFMGGGFLLRTYPEGTRVRIIVLETGEKFKEPDVS